MNDENEEKKPQRRHDRPGRSPMLTLVFLDQRRQSFAYAYLLESSYRETVDEDQITLNFGFVTIQISGRELESTYRDIVLHNADELHVVEEADLPVGRGGILDIHPEYPEKGDT